MGRKGIIKKVKKEKERIKMYISERQIEAVVKTLKDNEYRLSDGYGYYYFYDKEDNYRPDGLTDKALHDFDLNFVLREIAIDIINNLNEVIYNVT